MLWRLPARAHSLYVSHHCRCRYSTAARVADPLRILFCGSDAFSIASLRKLVQAKQDAPDLIHSIDVVHRPAKRTGRNLKNMKEGRLRSDAADENNNNNNNNNTF